METQTISIRIDGQWTAKEMAEFFGGIKDLYNLRLVLEGLNRDVQMRGWEWTSRRPGAGVLPPSAFFPIGWAFSDPSLMGANLGGIVLFEEELRVERVQFASPGITDLVGVGQILGHVKDVILRLLEYLFSQEQRRLENYERELAIEVERLRLTKEYISLAKELGATDTQLRNILHWSDERLARLENFIRNGQIVSVEWQKVLSSTPQVSQLKTPEAEVLQTAYQNEGAALSETPMQRKAKEHLLSTQTSSPHGKSNE